MIINNKNTSSLALGTAGFGTGVSTQEAFGLIDVYRDLGGNIIDTARVYGESESTLGKYLAASKCRHELIICTKGGHYDLITQEKRINRREIYLDVEMSLKNLGTDYADIYFLHRDDEDIPVDEIMDILHSLIRDGKICSIGVSNWHPERIRVANAYADAHNLPRIIANQIKHSAALTVYESDPTLVSMDQASKECCKDENLAVFAYTSQAKGLFSKLDRLGIDNIDEGLKREFICDENIRRFAELKALSIELDRPISQLALATLLYDKEIDTIPIIGGKTPEQIEDSFAATSVNMSIEQYNRIMKK